MSERGDERPKVVEEQAATEAEPTVEAGGTEAAPSQETPDQAEADGATGELREELARVQHRFEEAEASRQQLWDRYLRLQADFDNFRRRTERERAEWQEQALEDLIRQMLPVLDNLERAVSAAPGDEAVGGAAAKAMASGVKMVYDQLCAVLEGAGLKAVESLGQPFDPRLHEAVDRVEAPGHDPDSVVEELQRGYLFRSKLIRPSMVRVAQVPEGEGGNGIG